MPWLYESEGGPYFFRLQCPSGWEVTEGAQWQLTKQIGAQSGAVISTFVITGGGAKFIKRAAFISKIRTFYKKETVSDCQAEKRHAVSAVSDGQST